MEALPNCPACESEFTYVDANGLYVCPMCAHEWSDADIAREEEAAQIVDANGNVLADGDSIALVKDLSLSGKDKIKQGTKAKNIRLLDEPVNGHDIECSIDGFGRLYLKSEFVKKI